MQPGILDLNGVVAKVEWLLRRLLGANVNLLAITTRDIGLVRADSSRLEQVLLNIAVNAREAMPDGGTLTLATASVVLDQTFARTHPGAGTGPHVMLSITDTGTGMTEEVRAHLFEPFFTTKEPRKGTGWGLTTAHGFVRHIGGYITADSAPDRGTTVRLYLPRLIGAESALQDKAHGDAINVHD